MFEVNNTGIRFDSFLDSIHMCIDEGYFYAIAGHAVVQESECAAIERIAGYYAITCMEQCQRAEEIAPMPEAAEQQAAAFEHNAFSSTCVSEGLPRQE